MSDAFSRRHGYYFEDLEPGMAAALSKAFSGRDVEQYARLSTDTNPLHLDEAFAVRTRAGGRVLHGMLTASLISALVGTRLPGPGCLWMGLEIRFLAPVRIDERVHARAEVSGLEHDKQRVRLAVACTVAGAAVLEGTCLVWVPSRQATGAAAPA